MNLFIHRTQTFIYPIVLLILITFFNQSACTIPTISYSYPSIILDPNATISVNTGTRGNMSQLVVSDLFIFGRTANGAVMIWDMFSQQLLY